MAEAPETIRIQPANWTVHLAKAIETAPAGSTIVVPTGGMRELGVRAAARKNRPDLTFEVDGGRKD